MKLKALDDVPPLGSFRDRYLRMAMGRERHIEFQRLLMEFVSFRHKVGPEGVVSDNKTGYDLFKTIVKLYHPDSEVEQQEQDNVMKRAVEKFLEKNRERSLLDEPVPAEEPKPMDVTPVERKSIWGQMQEEVKE